MNLTRIQSRAWDALANDLRNDILSGRLQSGEAIRPELQLANNYNISRNSVRKALDALTSEGLLRRAQGSGTFVAPLKEQIRNKSIARRQILFISMETELSDDCAHSTFVPIFDSLSNLLGERGFNLLYSSIDLDHKPPASLVNKDVCGVIFHGTMPLTFWEKYIRPLPSVGLQHSTPEIDCNWVKIDNMVHSFKAVKHLRDLGHTRIGFFSNEQDERITRERCETYRRSMEMLGLPVEESWVITWQRPRSNGILPQEEYSVDYGEPLLQAFRDPAHAPTALICADNYRALSVEHTLSHIGLKVPQDVSLVGGFNYNDTFRGRFTALDGRLKELCQEAIDLLLSEIDGTCKVHNKCVIIRPELIIGQSTLAIRKMNKETSK